jgi:hypothetical protein
MRINWKQHTYSYRGTVASDESEIRLWPERRHIKQSCYAVLETGSCGTSKHWVPGFNYTVRDSVTKREATGFVAGTLREAKRNVARVLGSLRVEASHA